MGMLGEDGLPSNAYYPRTPDYTFYSGVYVWAFWFVIRLWIYEFEFRYYDRNYFCSKNIEPRRF